MDNPAKGGRGKKAPYESSHYRLPLPLKPLAEEMAANYRELVGEYENPEDPALIAAVLSAIAGNQQARQDSQQTKELLQQYQQMKVELEELHQKVERFKSVNQAVAILTEALKIRANVGGAIKEKIKEALALLV